jgi:predicted nucleic acid-binding protein
LKALFDTCSVINLVNADALELACTLGGVEWWLPPTVVDEAGTTCAAALLDLQQRGRIRFVDDHEVDGDRYLALLEEHKLGAGETECLAISLTTDHHICCDDRKARRAAVTLIGQERVFGTVRLLRWCVEQRLIVCSEAKRLLRTMREMGGFLPDTPQTFFCTD